MKIISYFTRVIEYCFYALFFLVPLIFSGSTSELFEFNKMWLTFGLTIIIVTAWLSKMLLSKRFAIQRTSLDIPILLFLLSQIISTLFSLDSHISFWGYYSRFNGGLLSTISYILLYYAFVSNLEIKHVFKTITISLISGLIVALWGLPSHFGADPTCFVFRGSFDTSCWTDAFKPTIREFSTLGQPDWLAAYLAVLLPISMAYGLNQALKKSTKLAIGNWKFIFYLLLSALFYLDLIFANARAGFVAFWVANGLFWLLVLWKKLFSTPLFLKYLLIFNACFLLLSFFYGIPIGSLNKFTLNGMNAARQAQLTAQPVQIPTPQASQSAQPPVVSVGANITDSGTIRLLVWRGAIAAWKAHPIFGTGVETFAFAYYQFRPAEHNLTSEWDYLYNKAHNEYLNYLTTTGIVGLGTYMAFLLLFTFVFFKFLIFKSEKTPLQPTAQQIQQQKQMRHLNVKDLQSSENAHLLLSLGLYAAWITILITNFFGFSVVMMNLFLFLIPAFVLLLNNNLNPHKTFGFPTGAQTNTTNAIQWTGVVISGIIACFLLLGLFQYWYADVAYALGTNLDHSNQFDQGYQQLTQAIATEPNEPVYQDEAALNFAALSAILYDQKDATNGAQFAQKAITLSDNVVSQHPNDVVFWKDRVRVFFTIAQGDKANQGQYYSQALQAIEKASELAPSDAKTWYNLGVLYGQTGDIQKGIETLQRTVQLKPDYRDAYFALGLFYHQLAVDKDDKVTDPAMQQKAIATYQYILDHISSADQDAKKSINQWSAQQ